MSMLPQAGGPTGPQDLPGAWSLDPLIVVGILLACWWYGRGVRAVWRSAGRGNVVSSGQVVAFGAGIAAVVVALISPLDALSEVLFGAHMVQHVLLTLVSAPLLVVSSPLQTMAWGLPPHLRRRAGRWQGRVRALLWWPGLPVAGLAVYTLVFTAWHLPFAYDAALRNDAVHMLEHTTMIGSALAFWAPIVRPRRTSGGVGVVLLFISLIASGILAALLVFTPTAWYAHPPMNGWGLTPLEDQQIAGAVMWVGGGIIYVVTGAIVLMHWLRADEEATARRERHLDRTTTAPPRRT